MSSRSEFARLLDQATGGAGPDISTYNKWERGKVVPPAWILVLAAEVAGITVSALLEEPEGDERPRPEYMARMARMERQVDELTAFVQRELERRRRNSSEQAAGS